MYFVLALLAALCYALDGTLMAKVYRSMDRLSAVSYRGLALALSMSPLLFFVPQQTFAAAIPYLPFILCSCLITAIANLLAAIAISCLPIGLVVAFETTLATIIVTLSGFFVFHQQLSITTVVAGSLLLVSLAALGLAEPSKAQAQSNYRKGIPAALAFGVLLGIGISLMAYFANATHPFLAAYLWEGGIGVCAFGFAQLRRLAGAVGFQRVTLGSFGEILLRCLPTLGGSSCYAYACTIGFVSLVAATVSSSMVIASLLAFLLYREILTRIQWALICVIFALVGILKLLN